MKNNDHRSDSNGLWLSNGRCWNVHLEFSGRTRLHGWSPANPKFGRGLFLRRVRQGQWVLLHSSESSLFPGNSKLKFVIDSGAFNGLNPIHPFLFWTGWHSRRWNRLLVMVGIRALKTWGSVPVGLVIALNHIAFVVGLAAFDNRSTLGIQFKAEWLAIHIIQQTNLKARQLQD